MFKIIKGDCSGYHLNCNGWNRRWFTVWISGTDQSDRTVRAL